MSDRLEELYKEETRKLDEKVWKTANKRGQSKPKKEVKTAAEKVEDLKR